MPIEHNEENRQPNYRPFHEMVANLFNAANFNNQAAGLMHAAIGISGEATEFLFHENNTNFMEEAGDLEFYLEALYQQASLSEFAVVLYEARAEHADVIQPTELAYNQILQSAADILDQAKKIWVYNKPLDGTVKNLFAIYIGTIQGALIRLYAWKNMDRAQVINFNQTKLGKRYPGGVYTDAHAQARLDKQEG